MTTRLDRTYLPDAPWTGGRTLVVFAAWLFGGLVGSIVASAFGFDPLQEAAGLAMALAFQSAAALLAVTLYSQSRGSGSLAADVGLVVRPRHWYGILLGFAVQLAIGLVLLPLSELLDIEQDTQAVSDLAAGTLDTSGRVLLFLAFVLAAPVVEEVLFRGVLLSWLTKRLNRHAAVVVSALIFGFAHWEGPGVLLPVIGLTLLAVPLAYATLRLGNLSLAIIMHAGINLLAFVVLVFEEDLTELVEESAAALVFVARCIA
jgi:membrane protease YdiL (CAAX protease family)